jgi:hypothetical protein
MKDEQMLNRASLVRGGRIQNRQDSNTGNGPGTTLIYPEWG